MRLRLTPLAALLVLAAAGAGCGGGGQQPRTTGEERHLTIRVQSVGDADALMSELGATITDQVPERKLYRIRIVSHDTAAAIAQKLRLDPRLLSVEDNDVVGVAESGVEGNPIHVPFDFVRAHDANYGSIAAGGSVNQDVYAQMHLGDSHQVTRGAGVVVAVLDTGVLATHADLRTRLVAGYNAIDESQPPDDAQDGADNGEWGHGTMVSGIVARLAPDAKLMPIRVLNADGAGSIVDVVQGIRWAVAHGADVINLSFGTRARSEALEEAIDDALDAGCTVVAAAGNANSDIVQYPAGYGDVVSVAAVESDDKKAPYSNFGGYVRVSAPGTGIRSTFADGGYAAWSGTSFAAPLVSAGAALVRAAHPTWTGKQAGEALRETARDIDSNNLNYAGKLGKGVIDLQRAVRSTD